VYPIRSAANRPARHLTAKTKTPPAAFQTAQENALSSGAPKRRKSAPHSYENTRTGDGGGYRTCGPATGGRGLPLSSTARHAAERALLMLSPVE
jgi:hypothetical protein